MKRFLNLTLATIILFTCKKENQDDELHLQQTPYLGDELRIDGFYFRDKEHSNSTQVFFLYSNGIILGGSSFQNTNWEQKLINAIHTGSYRNTTLKYKDSWGLFEIEDSILRFEKWYPNSPGPKRAFVREGIIINDTTFHILSSYRFENGKKVNIRERDERYHFREFSPKPDSTNPFIP